jgi:hypothetical protein
MIDADVGISFAALKIPSAVPFPGVEVLAIAGRIAMQNGPPYNCESEGEGKKVDEMTRTTRARGGRESRQQWRRGLAASAASLALLGGEEGLAPPGAHADATDDQFVSTVRGQGGLGLNIPASALAHDGHMVCSYLVDQGWDPSALAAQLSSSGQMPDPSNAWTFVEDSISFYCPSQLPYVGKPKPSH